MELWVLSQEGNIFMKVDGLKMLDDNRTITDGFITLGVYESKKRCKEIIQEVKNKMEFSREKYDFIIYNFPKN